MLIRKSCRSPSKPARDFNSSLLSGRKSGCLVRVGDGGSSDFEDPGDGVRNFREPGDGNEMGMKGAVYNKCLRLLRMECKSSSVGKGSSSKSRISVVCA